MTRAELRTLVVDDEAPARRRLRTLLAGESNVVLVGECPDGPAAVDAIAVLRPDLLFLDVQMPEMNGFDVLRAVGANAVPALVFVTAYDQYALQAFDAHALDYLLKPFTNTRFREMLERARRWVAAHGEDRLHRRLEDLLSSTTRAPRARIPVRSGDRVTLLDPSEIEWLEGAGNYVRIHTAGQQHLVRQTLRSLGERLDPGSFLRIHHSRIVNVDRVRELRAWGHGEYVVILKDGTRLQSSRTYAEALRRLVES